MTRGPVRSLLSMMIRRTFFAKVSPQQRSLQVESFDSADHSTRSRRFAQLLVLDVRLRG